MVKQYQKLFEMDGVVLEFDDEALQVIAKMAIKRKTGARGLRAILEDIMLNVMYEIPSRDDIEKCIITKDTVLNKQEPMLIIMDGQKQKKQVRKPKTKRKVLPD